MLQKIYVIRTYKLYKKCPIMHGLSHFVNLNIFLEHRAQVVQITKVNLLVCKLYIEYVYF